jgi:cytochrome c-type biogenesis protein CcmH
MMKKLLLALCLTLVTPAAFSAAPAWAAPVEGTFTDPRLEARAHALQRQLRCMVCQGQSIDESNAELAQDLRRLVREQIAAGKSDSQILDYLHARYGDFILMQPPVENATLLLWLAPLLALGVAGGVAWVVISRARKLPESNDLAA